MLRKIIFAVLVLALFVSMPAFSGDTYEQTVNREIFPTGVMYWGTVDMTSDSVGNFYTDAMFVGNCNTNNAFIWAYCSEAGTEDVNVFAQYAQMPDGTYVLAAEASGKIIDALGTTATQDTITVTAGVSCKVYPTARWLSLKFDGQTGNPLTTVTWYVFLKFDSTLTADWDRWWTHDAVAPVMKRTD
ncbi:MAG: hypothetical protein H8D67_12730 [Deltaproteobacteria bacterium]|nr:hypothetical protein [Deltaproteobacteria bacterium]